MTWRRCCLCCLVALWVGCSNDNSSSSTGDTKPLTKDELFARVASATKAACTNVGKVEDVLQALTTVKEQGFEKDLGPVAEVPRIWSKLQEAKKDADATLDPKPEKPVYEKPEYSGAWPINGLCRGRYETDQGIVLQANGKYYVVKDAEPCTRPYLTGYVESTGQTVTLNLGRDGRQAAVVKVSDRETYLDDQKKYREDVAQAQKTYQDDVKDYPQRVKEWEATSAALTKKRASAERIRSELAKKLRIAMGCDGGSGATTSNQNLKRHEGVDPDCYQDGVVCKTSRLADAEALVAKVAAAAEATLEGWPLECFQVRYIGGTAGEKDAISVTVMCAVGTVPPTKAQLTKLGATLKGMVGTTPLVTNVDLLQVTDGDSVDIKIPLASPAHSDGGPHPITRDGSAKAPPVEIPTPQHEGTKAEEKRPESSTQGYLAVTTQPSARVAVDGKDTGLSTPVTGNSLPLAPGRHKVRLVVGDQAYTYDVTIEAGKTAVLRRDLQ